MNTEAELMQAIIERPSDDMLRLALADWWEEFGNEEQRARAKFVRLQCDKASNPNWHGFLCLPKHPCKSCRQELRLWRQGYISSNLTYGRFANERPLSARLCVGHDQAPLQRPQFSGRLDRGFVAQVSCTLADWYGTSGDGHGPAIVRSQPVERVTLTDREPARNMVGAEY